MLCKRILKALPVALLAVVVMCSVSFAGTAGADTAGTVHFERFTESTFDQYLENPSPTIQSWLNTHIWRMGTYTPYFNGMTSWYPNAWMYKDSYALYTDESIATQHPEWVLRDASGNPLYIPWGCSNGTCPQYAGNIANQAFRQWWISNAKTELSSASYRGLFVDDVNMEMRVGNGHEEAVAPIDPATGQPMTATAWRAYMAQFMQEIRADLPNYEIVQNAIWYSDGDAGTSDASIRNQISASNYVYLERGVNDSGITGGSGQWSLNALFSFIDQVHALGKGVVLDGTSGSVPAMEYNLASYFLVSSGNDGVSGAGQTPENWWAGWNVNLGEATGPRYIWDNLLRRDFAGGMVLVNPPGAPTVTVSLPTPMQDVNGNSVTSIALPAASGAILVGVPQTTTPTTPQPTTPTPTETTVEAKPVGGSPASLPVSGSSGSKGSSGSGSSTPTSGTTPTPAKRPSSPHKSGKSRARLARTARTRRSRHRVARTRVSGSVKQATHGHLTIQLEARLGHRWARVRRLTTNINANGYFTHIFGLRPTIRYRVQALYEGAPSYRPSRSRYRQILPHAR